MDIYERKYIETYEKYEYLLRKVQEMTTAPADQLREIAWEAYFHIIDQTLKPLETHTEKARGAA